MGLVDAMYFWFLSNSYLSMMLEKWVFRVIDQSSRTFL